MKIPRTVLLCGSALLLTSCTNNLVPLLSFAHFSPPVKQTANMDTNSAVVFGRFGTGPDFAFGNELALRLCSESSKRVYLIRCRDKDSVYAVAVEPGYYRVAGFLATYMDHRPVGGTRLPEFGPFPVRSGSVTYLGDFNGYAKVSPAGGQTWGIKGVTNNFPATTDEYRLKYPNLAPVPVFSAFNE